MTAADFITVCRIIETDVFGALAFHTDCADCADWRCHRRPHDTEAAAIACAERHQAAKH